MGTHFSYAIIAVVSFMQGDYASLDLLFLFYQEKRNRGFAAYEAEARLCDGVFYQKEVLSTALCRGGIFL